MDPKFQFVLGEVYPQTRYRIISTICQTLLYGIYLCLIPITVQLMVTNGLQSRARKWLLAITTFMFTLSTMDWIFSVVHTFILVNSWNSTIMACYGSDNASSCLVRRMEIAATPSTPLMRMFDDILLVNCIIADGIVVWRAWALCSDKSKVVLMIPVVMLAINTVIYLWTVAVRAIVLASELQGGNGTDFLNRMHTGTQITHQLLSLSVNCFATSIIGLKAWKYRKLLMESGMGVRTPRGAIRILALLVDSGMIYILIGVTILVSIASFLSTGLSEITTVFLRLGTQLAGMYPIVVVLLVEQNRSLETTFCSFGTIIDSRGGRPSQTKPTGMSFAPGPVLASGGHIDLASRSLNTDIHLDVTLGSTFELGDVGIGARRSKTLSEDHAVS